MVLCWSEPDQCYVVTLPAWPNARTHGTTPTEAVQNGRDVLSLLIKSAKRHGEVIPPRLNQWLMTKLAG